MNKLQTKLVVAAIDFGTTYSGYAFSFKHHLEEDILKVQGKNWKNSQISKLSKIPTVILFDREGKFHSFGYEAEEKYADLADEDNHIGWKYFKHFKMALHGQKILRHNLRLTDDQGKKMFAKDVFAAAILYLKNDLLETMKQRAPDFQETDVMWIITVPTIWKYGAKQFMKEAAVKAGIPDDQFTFALEPEAGAVFCEQLEIKKSVDLQGETKVHKLGRGSNFMIVDLGGGTADITISEVQGDGTLGELYPPSGGPWGGTLVDNHIKEFLENLFGIAVMKEFIKEYKCEHLVLVESIEMKKRDFGKSSDGVKLRLSHHLLEIYRKHNSITGNIQDDINSKGFGDAVNLNEKHHHLKISYECFKRMFEESVENLTKHLNYLFERPELKNVNIIMMIGGFSESAVMQKAVKEAFPNKTVIIPEEAGLAVLRGAVIYGYKQNLISSRKVPYTYGISVAVPFDVEKHPKKKLHLGKCEDVFHPFLWKGDTIIPGETKVQHAFNTPSETYTVAEIEVYQSFADDRKELSFIDDSDMEKAGILQLYLEKKPGSEDKSLIDITMHFGSIELEVEAKERGSEKQVKAKFNCLYH